MSRLSEDVGAIARAFSEGMVGFRLSIRGFHAEVGGINPIKGSSTTILSISYGNENTSMLLTHTMFGSNLIVNSIQCERIKPFVEAIKHKLKKMGYEV